MRFRMLQPATVLAVALLLTGCVPSEPVITPAPDPTATPIFATDEDALAAATAAYGKYLEVSDLVRAEGGVNPERIADYVTAERLREELQGFKAFADQGRSTVGKITFDGAKLQMYEDQSPGIATVVFYLCQDATAVKFVDAAGNDVTPADKPGRQLFEITMVSSPIEASTLVLSGSEIWSSESGC